MLWHLILMQDKILVYNVCRDVWHMADKSGVRGKVKQNWNGYDQVEMCLPSQKERNAQSSKNCCE